MDIILKILITQMALLVCGHLLMHPSTFIADFVEKVFKDYEKGLDIINGVQIILIVVTLIVWMWRVY